MEKNIKDLSDIELMKALLDQEATFSNAQHNINVIRAEISVRVSENEKAKAEKSE